MKKQPETLEELIKDVAQSRKDIADGKAKKYIYIKGKGFIEIKK